MKKLVVVAFVLNAMLLWNGLENIFLQTHWDSPWYVQFVISVMATPIVNAVAIYLLMRRDAGAPPAT